jgi:hypothetical protein
VTAWRLSSFSGNQIVRALVPSFMALFLLAIWTVIYIRNPTARSAADHFVAAVHTGLPKQLQDVGSVIWHSFLPDWVIRQVGWAAGPLTV